MGYTAAGIMDLNGDGVNDVFTGVPWDDDGGGGAGSCYILFMQTDGFVGSMQKIGNSYGGLSSFYSPATNDYFGQSVAYLGDIDGDDVQDVAVSASGDDDGSASASGA